MAVPNAVKSKADNNIIMMAIGTKAQLTGLNPIINEISSTSVPCSVATVAPPNVRPIIILNLDTGATRVSFKKPNCLSQIISIPENTEVKIKVIPIA